MEVEDWGLDETLSRAERLVSAVRARQTAAHRRDRLDPPHAFPGSPTCGDRPMNSNLRPAAQPNTSVVWTVLALGLAVFVCGAALMGLALLYQREQLWQVGLPMVLGGQLAVLAVVIWQLESVWQSNRATFVALHALDEQLRHIRRETRASGPSASVCERTDQEADCRGAPPDGDRS